MLSSSGHAPQAIVNCGSTVLVTPDSQLASDLQLILQPLGLRVATATDTDAGAAIASLGDTSIILMDVRSTGLASGRLLAAMHESGVHRCCAIAVIAEEISDEWIARLREGAIDDIVPRGADAATWKARLSAMRRGREVHHELERLREAILSEAQRDRITGVFNRETMLTILFRETDRVQRMRGSLSLVLFDIDDFGYWNNEFGRDACDNLLRELAARAGRMLRSYDLLGRTSGDEFLFALPGCSVINASMMAERLRIEVFGEPFVVKDCTTSIRIRLTASFGIASSRGRSPIVVLREARQALDLSRQTGPDSIRCAGESLDGSLAANEFQTGFFRE